VFNYSTRRWGIVPYYLLVLMIIASAVFYAFAVNGEYSGASSIIDEGIRLSYNVAVDSIVLLKNNGVLPLKPGTKIAVFGAGQHNRWYYHGGGSSHVTIPQERVVTLYKALKLRDAQIVDWLSERYLNTLRDLVVSEDDVYKASLEADVAIVVISRYSSEDVDIPLDPKPICNAGLSCLAGYRLLNDELKLIELVTKYFSNKTIVILNTPSSIDLSWDNPGVGAILWVGYPGEQGGLAVVDILLGRVSPSGKLPFTWARKYEDYPSARYFGNTTVYYTEDIFVGYRYFDTFNVTPLYPFGYGLSYTSFDIRAVNITLRDNTIVLNVVVNNTGLYPGREVVQVYVILPRGELDKEYQRLVAFAKTSTLKPGEVELVNIEVSLDLLASYSEKHAAWILEKGEYIVTVGNSSRNTKPVAVLLLNESVVLEKLKNRFGDPGLPYRLSSRGISINISLPPTIKILVVDTSKISTTDHSSDLLSPPELAPRIVSNNITLRDVVTSDQYSLEDLVSIMSTDELAKLLIGLQGLEKYGIPPLGTADGPNGVRQGPTENPGGTAFPAAVLRAASWDPELEFRVGVQIGREMAAYGLSLWLGPGVNIIRNPLCGRSFEYYSEDPLLTGVMGASVVKGVQSQGVGATVKHFVGNEQETERVYSDSRISERALREIYLKPFEIIIKTAKPWAVMSAYNKINGVYASNNYALLTLVLRGEWGFDGIVMTDWGAVAYSDPVIAVKAGVNAIMPTGDPSVIINAVKNGELPVGYLQLRVIELLNITRCSISFAQYAGMNLSKICQYLPPSGLFNTTRTLWTETVTPVTTTGVTPSITTPTPTTSPTTTVATQPTRETAPLWDKNIIAIITAIIVILVLLFVTTWRVLRWKG